VAAEPATPPAGLPASRTQQRDTGAGAPTFTDSLDHPSGGDATADGVSRLIDARAGGPPGEAGESRAPFGVSAAGPQRRQQRGGGDDDRSDGVVEREQWHRRIRRMGNVRVSLGCPQEGRLGETGLARRLRACPTGGGSQRRATPAVRIADDTAAGEGSGGDGPRGLPDRLGGLAAYRSSSGTRRPSVRERRRGRSPRRRGPRHRQPGAPPATPEARRTCPERRIQCRREHSRSGSPDRRAGAAGPLAHVGALPERAPVGHGAGGLLGGRQRLGARPPRPRPLAGLPLGGGRPAGALGSRTTSSACASPWPCGTGETPSSRSACSG
jgi:hypothetical protein